MSLKQNASGEVIKEGPLAVTRCEGPTFSLSASLYSSMSTQGEVIRHFTQFDKKK